MIFPITNLWSQFLLQRDTILSEGNLDEIHRRVMSVQAMYIYHCDLFICVLSTETMSKNIFLCSKRILHLHSPHILDASRNDSHFVKKIFIY